MHARTHLQLIARGGDAVQCVEAPLALAVPQCARALLATAPAAAAGTAAAPAPRLQAMSDDEARWWLLLLAQLVRNGGAALLPHMDTLRAVLRAAGRATQPKVLKAAYKLRRRLLQASTPNLPWPWPWP